MISCHCWFASRIVIIKLYLNPLFNQFCITTLILVIAVTYIDPNPIKPNILFLCFNNRSLKIKYNLLIIFISLQLHTSYFSSQLSASSCSFLFPFWNWKFGKSIKRSACAHVSWTRSSTNDKMPTLIDFCFKAAFDDEANRTSLFWCLKTLQKSNINRRALIFVMLLTSAINDLWVPLSLKQFCHKLFTFVEMLFYLADFVVQRHTWNSESKETSELLDFAHPTYVLIEIAMKYFTSMHTIKCNHRYC